MSIDPTEPQRLTLSDAEHYAARSLDAIYEIVPTHLTEEERKSHMTASAALATLHRSLASRRAEMVIAERAGWERT